METTLLFDHGAGKKTLISESNARRLVAVLREDIEGARAAGPDARITIEFLGGAIARSMTQAEAARFAADIETKLSLQHARALSGGRALGKIARVTLDDDGEIAGIQTIYQY